MSVKSEPSDSGVLQAAVLIGVRIAPGEIEFTRILNGASSCASVFMRSITPPFDAA